MGYGTSVPIQTPTALRFKQREMSLFCCSESSLTLLKQILQKFLGIRGKTAEPNRTAVAGPAQASLATMKYTTFLLSKMTGAAKASTLKYPLKLIAKCEDNTVH